MRSEQEHLYEQLAHELATAINTGSLRSGARLPSVRKLAERRGVSIATAVAAYGQLESQGLLEVRPKSGHFVRARSGPVAEPRAARKSVTSTRPSVATAVAALQRSMRNPSVVPLGSATIAPELLPLAMLNRTLAAVTRESGALAASYDVPPGSTALRRQLARRSVDWGRALHADDFVTTTGAAEGIYLCLSVVAGAGDAIAVESPTYFGILQAIEALGMRAIEIPTHPRTGLDVDALGEVLRTTTVRAVVAVTNASNPLGAVMPDDAKERLVRLLARHDVPLIEDDVYGDLVFEGPRPRTAQSYDREGRVLLCGSVSKTLAPDYRVGWVVPGRYGEALRARKYALSLACPAMPQLAVAEVLSSGGYDRHLRRLRAVLASQTAWMRDAVAERFPAGTRVSNPQGGFVLWVELPAGVDALELQARALERNVVVAPGPVFSARGRFGSCVRLSAGQPRSERIDRAIDTLAGLAHDALRAGRRAG